MYLVLSGLNDSLFWIHQSEKVDKIFCNDILISFLLLPLIKKSTVSSAYSCIFDSSIILVISLIYIKKNDGPRTDP